MRAESFSSTASLSISDDSAPSIRSSSPSSLPPLSTNFGAETLSASHNAAPAIAKAASTATTIQIHLPRVPWSVGGVVEADVWGDTGGDASGVTPEITSGDGVGETKTEAVGEGDG